MLKINIYKLKQESKIGRIIINHILNNKRGYVLVTILFFIGLIDGVLFINNMNDTKIEEINNYFNNMVNNIKNYENIDLGALLKKSVISDLIMILILWFGASTIIGISIVYGAVIFKGFSIGYTISCIITCFGIVEGILIAVITILFHNMFYIPSMFGASVSGIKLYQSIMKSKYRDNIKTEVLRHTFFCIFMLVLMMVSSLIEVYLSTNLLISLITKI